MVKEIVDYINQDKIKHGSYDRYPVRFVFCPLSTCSVTEIASKLIINIVPFSKFFPKDKWITADSVYNLIIKEINGSNSDLLFCGLSEILRFLDVEKLKSFIINLTEIESDEEKRKNKRRVYFLMSSLENLLSICIQKNHHRISFYNPIINANIQPEIRPKMVISDIIRDEVGSNNLPNVSDYLDISFKNKKIDFHKTIYCSSNAIIDLVSSQGYLNDDYFPYRVILKYEELLKEKIIGLDFEKISYNVDSNFLKWLSEGINADLEEISLDDFVKNKLNLNSVDVKELLLCFLNYHGSMERSLLKMYFKLLSDNNVVFLFLYNLIDKNNVNTKTNFIENLYLNIEDKNTYEIRKEIIHMIKDSDGKISAPESYFEVFSKKLNEVIKKHIPNFEVSIEDNFYTSMVSKMGSEDKVSKLYDEIKHDFINKVLTSESDVEKRIIICLTKSYIFNEKELSNIYPSFYGYLYYRSNSFSSDSYLDEYFQEYKISKIANSPTEKFRELMHDYTSEKFLEFYNSNKYSYLDNGNKANYIFVFDGVGAEYLPLICYYLEEEYKIYVKSSEYRKALLPTITRVNKTLLNQLESKNEIWINDFDKQIIHGNCYSVEYNLASAISLLKELLHKVIEQSNGESFLICADHGSTVSHKIFNISKKYDFEEAEHDGRCCEKSKIKKTFTTESKDYIEYDSWIISINQESLCGKSRYEVHGGGTVEEIFVPCVYYAGNNYYSSCEISVIKNEVSGIDKTIKFKIKSNTYVNPSDITVIEETGSKSSPIISSEGVYTCNLSVGRTQNVRIIIQGQEKTIQVIGKGGISSTNGGIF